MCVLQTKLKHPEYQPMAKESLQLAVHFLFHTYLHTKKKLRYVRSAPTPTPVHGERPSQAAVFHPDSVGRVLTGWTPRSGWPPWRCCSLRAAKRASGWCSTWLDRRDERSLGQGSSARRFTPHTASAKHQTTLNKKPEREKQPSFIRHAPPPTLSHTQPCQPGRQRQQVLSVVCL